MAVISILSATLAASVFASAVNGAAIARRYDYPAQPPCSYPYTPFNYVGCYIDPSIPNRALDFATHLDFQNMTVEKCTASCKANGFRYAGLEYYGQCFCGDSVRSGQALQAECNFPCSADKSETCGGFDRVSIYQDPTFKPVDYTTISDYANLGCYSEGYNGRAIAFQQVVNFATMTTESCLQACKNSNYPLAATEYHGECYCGVVVGNGSTKADESNCNTPCAGNPAEMCGGANYLNLYMAAGLAEATPCGPNVQPSPTVVMSSATASTAASTKATTSVTSTLPTPMTSTTASTSSSSTYSSSSKAAATTSTTTASSKTSTSATPSATSTSTSATYYPISSSTSTSNSISTRIYSTSSSTSIYASSTSSSTPAAVSTSTRTTAYTISKSSTSSTPAAVSTSTRTTAYTISKSSTSSTPAAVSTGTSTTAYTISKSSTSSTPATVSTSTSTTAYTISKSLTSSTPATVSTGTSTTPSITSKTMSSTSSKVSSTLTTSTTTTASKCIITVPVPTSEYCVGNYCSKPIPEFKDQDGCKKSYTKCTLQVSDCYKKAGDSSPACSKFKDFCENVSAYCTNTCSGPKCSKSDCLASNPPVGGPIPVPSICTSTTTAPATTSSVVPPTATNVCAQPSGATGSGYEAGKAVGGIELPYLTCNDLTSDYSQHPFKLYEDSESSSCRSYSRDAIPSACADACAVQYNACVGSYATSKKVKSVEIDSGKIDSGKIDSGKVDSGKVDSGKIDSGKVDSGKVDSEKVDSGKVDSEKVDSGKVDSGKVDSEKVDSGKVDSGKVDSGKIDSGKIDGSKDQNDSRRKRDGEASDIKEGGDDDTYDSANSKCLKQKSDCVELNKKTSVSKSRCVTFNEGWS